MSGYAGSAFTALHWRIDATVSRQRGDDFSLSAFYEEVDALGVIPVSLIRWEMTGEEPGSPAFAGLPTTSDAGQ